MGKALETISLYNWKSKYLRKSLGNVIYKDHQLLLTEEILKRIFELFILTYLFFSLLEFNFIKTLWICLKLQCVGNLKKYPKRFLWKPSNASYGIITPTRPDLLIWYILAICNNRCIHGRCTRPNFCTCSRGYRGPTCNERKLFNNSDNNLLLLKIKFISLSFVSLSDNVSLHLKILSFTCS